MLSGDNGILQKATTAKTETERQSIVEQARIDVLGYQAENKGGDLDKTQLKSVLDTYFKDVPDLTHMSDTEIKEKQLNTLAKYGTYAITVSEIYNGNIKTDGAKMISFKIRPWDHRTGFLDTIELQCTEGMTWAQWASSNNTPIYEGEYENMCGYFNGSLQELILSFGDDDTIEYVDNYDYYTYLVTEDNWEWRSKSNAIIYYQRLR